jgi:predicted nucleic acid-binding protein
LIYIDTSALLKLVLPEAESPSVDEYVLDRVLVSSSLLVVEARRGTLRRSPRRLPRLDIVLSRVEIVEMSPAVVESASRLPDPMLRSLDAIHLATALMIREELDAVLTYDDRLAGAATSHGLTVETPGATPAPR